MTEKEREQVAVFRFGLIVPIVNRQVDQKEYLAKIGEKKWMSDTVTRCSDT